MKWLAFIAALLIVLPACATEKIDSHVTPDPMPPHSLVPKSIRPGSLVQDPLFGPMAEQNDNCTPQGTEEMAWNFDSVDVEDGFSITHRSYVDIGGVIGLYCYKTGATALPECPLTATRGWDVLGRSGQGGAIYLRAKYSPTHTYTQGFKIDGDTRVTPKQDWSKATGSGGITISFHVKNAIFNYPIGSLRSAAFFKVGEWQIGTDQGVASRYDLCVDFVGLTDENTPTPPESPDYRDCGASLNNTNNYLSTTSVTTGEVFRFDTTWHHVVIRWDGTGGSPDFDGEVAYWLDEVLVGKQDVTGDMTDGTGDFFLGYGNGFTNFFNYHIDNLVVHRGVVPDANILAGELNCDWVDTGTGS